MTHDHASHDSHGHGHGHANDQGLKGAMRYLKMAPSMWKSSMNDAVVERLSPTAGETVVDIGAGMGAGSVAALRRGATVQAIEPTPFLRNVLNLRRWLERKREHLVVIDGSAEQMPLPDRSVEAVWSVNTMHHWVSVETAAVEIARVLRPGGRLLLVDEDFEDPTHPDHERFVARHADSSHGFSMVDAEAMGGLFQAAGLADVQATKERIDGRPSIVVAASGPATSAND